MRVLDCSARWEEIGGPLYRLTSRLSLAQYSLLVACQSTFARCATVDKPVGLPTVARLCVSSSERRLVGLTRFELVTPRLSSVCSNQLSYRPDFAKATSGEPLEPCHFKEPVSSGKPLPRLVHRSAARREGGFSQN